MTSRRELDLEARRDINVSILNIGPGQRATTSLLCFALGALVPVAPFLLLPSGLACIVLVAALAAEARPYSWEQASPLRASVVPAVRLVLGSALIGVAAGLIGTIVVTSGEACTRPFETIAQVRLRNALAVKDACVDHPSDETCQKAIEKLGTGLSREGAISETASTLKRMCDENAHADACDSVGEMYYGGAVKHAPVDDVWSYNRRACDLRKPRACLRAAQLIADKRHEPTGTESAETYIQKVCELRSDAECKLAIVLLATLSGALDKLEAACFDAPTNTSCVDYYTLNHRVEDLRVLCDNYRLGMACFNYAIALAKGEYIEGNHKLAVAYLEKACLFDADRFQATCDDKAHFVSRVAPQCYPSPKQGCVDVYSDKRDIDALSGLCTEYHDDIACWNAAVFYRSKSDSAEDRKAAANFLRLACRYDRDMVGNRHVDERYQSACSNAKAFLK